MVYKTQHRKVKTEQNEPNKNRGDTRCHCKNTYPYKSTLTLRLQLVEQDPSWEYEIIIFVGRVCVAQSLGFHVVFYLLFSLIFIVSLYLNCRHQCTFLNQLLMSLNIPLTSIVYLYQKGRGPMYLIKYIRLSRSITISSGVSYY